MNIYRYAVFNSEIGYYQSMNYIAAVLILHISDEEVCMFASVHTCVRAHAHAHAHLRFILIGSFLGFCINNEKL